MYRRCKSAWHFYGSFTMALVLFLEDGLIISYLLLSEQSPILTSALLPWYRRKSVHPIIVHLIEERVQSDDGVAHWWFVSFSRTRSPLKRRMSWRSMKTPYKWDEHKSSTFLPLRLDLVEPSDRGHAKCCWRKLRPQVPLSAEKGVCHRCVL